MFKKDREKMNKWWKRTVRNSHNCKCFHPLQGYMVNLELNGRRWVTFSQYLRLYMLCLLSTVFIVSIVLSAQVTSADEVVNTMINHMTNPDSQSHLPLKSGPPSVMSLLILTFNVCNWYIFECCLSSLIKETMWSCVWTTWEHCLLWRWLLLLEQSSTVWVTIEYWTLRAMH